MALENKAPSSPTCSVNIQMAKFQKASKCGFSSDIKVQMNVITVTTKMLNSMGWFVLQSSVLNPRYSSNAMNVINVKPIAMLGSSI